MAATYKPCGLPASVVAARAKWGRRGPAGRGRGTARSSGFSPEIARRGAAARAPTRAARAGDSALRGPRTITEAAGI